MTYSETLKKEANTLRSLSVSSRGLELLGRVCPWPLKAKGADLFMLLLVTAMVIFGLIMVYSSSYIYAHERTGDGFIFIKKQAAFALIGFVAMLGAYQINFRRWTQWGYAAVILATALLAMVLIPGLGFSAGGAQRWIGIGGFGFQPAELAKLALVVFVARQLDLKSDRLHRFSAGVVANFLVPLPALLLLLVQPDFGSAAIIILTILCMMFLAGVPLKHFFATLAIAGSALGLLIWSSPYRMTRFLTFLDPWSDPAGKGFQILQSLIGFHNGAWTGVGLGNGKEKLFFLPEAHNDFIFAVIGEELGFIGVALIVVAYSAFMYRGLKIGWDSLKKYGDRFGMLLACGITLVLGLQGFTNMGVVMGLLPTKGFTLPFISYGGTAIIINLFSVGILLSIAKGPRNQNVRS